MSTNTKCAALVSGGLDSLLAVKLIQEQGIFVQGLFFETPFFSMKKVKYHCEKNSIPLLVIPCFEEYKKMLLNPASGYGKHMNPCIDCHVFMLKKAAEYIHEKGFDFIITGEVLGERPMSQNRNSLNRVINLSGVRDLVLRPLSARHMKPTKPELDGLVDRERLEAIKGRGRKRQYELAEKYGIKEIPQPGGGCLLTDKNISERLRFLISTRKEGLTERDTRLLKVGRYLHLGKGQLLIVGRNEKENDILTEKYRKETDILFEPVLYPGPSALLPHAGNDESLISFSVSICARYSDIKGDEKAVYKVSTPVREFEVKSVKADDEEIKKRFDLTVKSGDGC
ncbi:MAG: tRNA 4-thiouridine(8) synthase ThiI [Candidatus Aureabacteria bacterium]|nr:tRNA 4-thiouridine(8) synthase ThiI [Candidatus Auribacterota bacterium]